MRDPLPPTAVAVGFIDRINHTDATGLGALMSADHTLQVFDESPLTGREENVEAWRGYFAAFPQYVIYPQRIVANGRVVAILGRTTGSHLELSDPALRLSVIWLVTVVNGLVERWQLVEDEPANRARYGLSDDHH